jgi:acetolactate synthase I/II/III large subunit
MIRVADYIMQRLALEGVRHLFLVTGRGMLYLSDAAAKNEDINCVPVHHEQAGGYAAMAYAQLNNSIGACMVSTGCASTNAITPVLCAWQDEVPMIVISGQNMLKETVNYTGLPIRTYGQQEANVVELVKPITKYATMLKDANDIAYVMDKAFFAVKNGKKGPVWIDIPLDLQNARIEPEKLNRFEGRAESFVLKDEDLKSICEDLNGVKRPIIIFGSAIRSTDSIELLKKFIEKHNYPVVYTGSGVDVYSTNHPLSMGVLSVMAGNRPANFAVQNCDYLLVFGNRLTAMATDNFPEKFARAAKIVVVDIDENEHKKGNINIDKVIVADVKDTLEKLLKSQVKNAKTAWIDKCKEWKNVFPKCEDVYRGGEKVDLYEFTEALSSAMDENDVLVTDAGLEELIIPTNLLFKDGQRCLHPVSQGAMGFALPAAVGGYYSSGKNIIAVIGDGSIMMNIQELQTIDHNRLPVKIIVINNNAYAVIRSRQQDLFRTRTIGTDLTNGLSCPDFKKVASCFNLRYERINDQSELNKLKDILKMDGPVICEVICNENQKYLHSSYRKGQTGKFVQPPLEDQSPFLDRDLFLSQMIIEPIDL